MLLTGGMIVRTCSGPTRPNRERNPRGKPCTELANFLTFLPHRPHHRRTTFTPKHLPDFSHPPLCLCPHHTSPPQIEQTFPVLYCGQYFRPDTFIPFVCCGRENTLNCRKHRTVLLDALLFTSAQIRRAAFAKIRSPFPAAENCSAPNPKCSGRPARRHFGHLTKVASTYRDRVTSNKPATESPSRMCFFTRRHHSSLGRYNS